MPLIKGKSEKSFKKNVATEVEAGKPLKQSLAIAYDVQRKAKAKKAHGGNPAENASTPAFREYAAEKLAEGGEVESKMSHHVCSKCGHSEEISDLESGSVAQKVLSRKKFAKGGAVEDDMVDLEANNLEGPAVDQSYNIKAKSYSKYDDSQLSKQPRGSNLKGHQLEDGHDRVGKIRSRMKKKGA
jgi:hypothetical protein